MHFVSLTRRHIFKNRHESNWLTHLADNGKIVKLWTWTYREDHCKRSRCYFMMKWAGQVFPSNSWHSKLFLVDNVACGDGFEMWNNNRTILCLHNQCVARDSHFAAQLWRKKCEAFLRGRMKWNSTILRTRARQPTKWAAERSYMYLCFCQEVQLSW